MNYFIKFIEDIFKNKYIILRIAIYDYLTMYRKNFLGIFWSILNPLIQIMIYYLVFGTGLKGAGVADLPYFLYLLCGIVPWFFIGPTLVSGAFSIANKASQLQKMNVNFIILPAMHLVRNFFNHLIMIILTIIIILFYGYSINFLLIYYIIATIFFVFAIIILLSSLVALIYDFGNLVNPLLKLSFWFLPILYNVEKLPKNLLMLIELNPMFYLINGYRKSLINYETIVYIPHYDIYFWTVSFFILIIGVNILYKYKANFYDINF